MKHRFKYQLLAVYFLLEGSETKHSFLDQKRKKSRNVNRIPGEWKLCFSEGPG